MKKINFKLIFLFLMGFMLMMTGCSVDMTYTVNSFTLKDEANNLYVREYSYDTESVLLNDIIDCNDKKAKVEFYLDESQSEKVESPSFLIMDGDNYVFCVITFSNGNTSYVNLNLYRLKLCTVTFETNCKTKVEEQIVEENSFIEEPNVTLERSGYAFVGWDYKFSKPITEDTVNTLSL